jgi:hypothetical protein
MADWGRDGETGCSAGNQAACGGGRKLHNRVRWIVEMVGKIVNTFTEP